jgi:hypothetical protein
MVTRICSAHFPCKGNCIVCAELEMPGVTAVMSCAVRVIAAERAGQAVQEPEAVLPDLCLCLLRITSRRCRPLHDYRRILD